MKIKKMNVYQCEHCRKRKLSSSWMKKHEERCTRNPQRECGFCGMIGGIEEEVVAFVKLLNDTADHGAYSSVGSKDLLDRMEGCPACTLAVIVQAKPRMQCDEYGAMPSIFVEFDYKAAKAEWWKYHNEF